MTLKKAIFVDPMNQTVDQLQLDAAADLSQVIKDYIEIAAVYDNGDTLYVAENGLFAMNDALHGKAEAFRAYLFDVGAHQPFAGYGVLVGPEDEYGHVTDVRTPIELFRQKVRFISPKASMAGSVKH